PNTTAPGNAVVQYDAPGWIRENSSMPSATIIGPMVIGMRGPMRCASAPARSENNSVITVTGNSDAPAAIGEWPSATWSSNTTSKRVGDNALYNESVVPLAPLNWRLLNSRSGSIGCVLRASTTKNAAIMTTAMTAAIATAAFMPPGPSMSA